MTTDRILPPGRLNLQSKKRVTLQIVDNDTGATRTVLGYQYRYEPEDGEPFGIASEFPCVMMTIAI